jgi:hypothetical protein
VLYFGKSTADLSNFILVAVSLDPYQAAGNAVRSSAVGVRLPDSADLQVEELMRGQLRLARQAATLALRAAGTAHSRSFASGRAE